MENCVNDEKVATQLHDAMFNAYGCADCECLGQNGCGYCAIGNTEFGQGEGDAYWGYNLMPSACNPDVYGDIVRSAAAAFVADKGSDRR